MNQALLIPRKEEISNTRNREELIDFWLKNRDVAEQTRVVYRNSINHLFRWMDEAGYREIDTARLIEFKTWLRTKANITVTTANNYLKAIKNFCSFCYDYNLAPRDYGKEIKLERENRDHKRPSLKKEQLLTLLDSIDTGSEKGARDYAIILLMAVTGLRVGSVASLKRCYLITREGRTVLNYIDKGGGYPDSFAVLTPHVVEAIENYLEMRGEIRPKDPLFKPMDRNTDHDHVNGCMSAKALSECIRKRIRDIGLPSPYSAQSIRHSTAQIVLQNGGTIRQVQQMLNHSDARTTEIYAQHADRIGFPGEDIMEKVLFSER